MTQVHVTEKGSLLNPNHVSFDERHRQIEEEKKREEEEVKRQKNSPYQRWIQVNKDSYKAEDWLMAKSPVAYRIFKFLMNNMDAYNAVMCSQTVLQEAFGISRTTVSRAIKLLSEKQYIEIYKSGGSNIYVVNKQIAWNSWGNNFVHGKFGANIILSESEQEEATKAKIRASKIKELSLVEEQNENPF